ncbi:MAG: cupin domain-containing protein [Clostridiaceae bacterium]|nr:cupin domain-containing protein [Clostridiaceae bacterium]
MIRRGEEMTVEHIQSMRGGNGEAQVVHILEKNEFENKGRLFAKNILKPGTSIGTHEHIGEFETYYIIRGEGIHDYNGVKFKVIAGDMGYTKSGTYHGIENIGSEDLEFIALVLFN